MIVSKSRWPAKKERGSGSCCFMCSCVFRDKVIKLPSEHVLLSLSPFPSEPTKDIET